MHVLRSPPSNFNVKFENPWLRKCAASIKDIQRCATNFEVFQKYFKLFWSKARIYIYMTSPEDYFNRDFNQWHPNYAT
jgi:hypothetical protein